MSFLSSITNELPTDGNRVILVDDKDQNVLEIIKAIQQNHQADKKYFDGIAKQFWKGNVRDTAKFLFDFCKKNVRYDIEPERDQTVKTPGRLLKDGYGDCKHYAGFIVGVCDALNRVGEPIEAWYRFVSDIPGKEVHHVFAVVSDGSKDYWVDPVIKYFNERPKFYSVKDYRMAISRLSGTEATEFGTKYNPGIVAGVNMMNREQCQNFLSDHGTGPEHFKSVPELQQFIFERAHKHPRTLMYVLCPATIGSTFDDDQVAGFFDDVAKGVKNTFNKVTDTVKKAVKDTGKGVEHTLSQAGKGLKKFADGQVTNANNAIKDVKHVADEVKEVALKVTLAAGRGPFLALVGMNAFNLGRRLYDTVRSSPEHRSALLRKWNDIGGSPTALINAINSGMRKHEGGKWNTNMKVSGIGDAGVSIATLMTLAAGIIAIISKLIHSSAPSQEPEMTVATKDGAAMIAVSADNVKNGLPPLPGMPGMDLTTGLGPNGQPFIDVNGAYHPAIQTAGQLPDGVEPTDLPGGGATTPEKGGVFALDKIFSGGLTFLKPFKVPLIGVAVGVVTNLAWGGFTKGKMAKRGPIVGVLVGVGAAYVVNKHEKKKQ